MRIGVDVDDVLANFIKKFRHMAHLKFGVDESIVPCDWKFSNFKLKPEQFSELWKEVADTNNFWIDLEPKEGCELMAKAEKKHDIFFISSRVASKGLSVKDQTGWWLASALSVHFPTVIITSEKGPLAAALKLEAFIDDRDKNCIEIAQAVPNCKVFLKDAGHNKNFNDFPRVGSFDEFYNILSN